MKKKKEKFSGIFFDEFQYIRADLKEFSILSRAKKGSKSNKLFKKPKQKRSKSENVSKSLKQKFPKMKLKSIDESDEEKRNKKSRRKKLPDVNIMNYTVNGKIHKKILRREKRNSFHEGKRSYSETKTGKKFSQLSILKENSNNKNFKLESTRRDKLLQNSYLKSFGKNQRKPKRYKFWEKNTIKQPPLKSRIKFKTIKIKETREEEEFGFSQSRRNEETPKKRKIKTTKISRFEKKKILMVNKKFIKASKDLSESVQNKNKEEIFDQKMASRSLKINKKRTTKLSFLQKQLQEAKEKLSGKDKEKLDKYEIKTGSFSINQKKRSTMSMQRMRLRTRLSSIPAYYLNDVKEKFMLAHQNSVGKRIREQMNKNVIEYRLLKGYTVPDFREELKIKLPESKKNNNNFFRAEK